MEEEEGSSPSPKESPDPIATPNRRGTPVGKATPYLDLDASMEEDELSLISPGQWGQGKASTVAAAAPSPWPDTPRTTGRPRKLRRYRSNRYPGNARSWFRAMRQRTEKVQTVDAQTQTEVAVMISAQSQTEPVQVNVPGPKSPKSPKRKRRALDWKIVIPGQKGWPPKSLPGSHGSPSPTNHENPEPQSPESSSSSSEYVTYPFPEECDMMYQNRKEGWSPERSPERPPVWSSVRPPTPSPPKPTPLMALRVSHPEETANRGRGPLQTK